MNCELEDNRTAKSGKIGYEIKFSHSRSDFSEDNKNMAECASHNKLIMVAVEITINMNFVTPYLG